jgi:hypothetical protein
VSVVPVPREDPVITLQHRTNTNGGRLLTDAEMYRTSHFLFRVEVNDPLLNHTNPDHVEKKSTT